MKVIHIGVGGFGGVWAQCLKQDRRVKVVGLVDASADALAAVCDKWGYSPDACFESLPAALRAVDADLLVCSTPPCFHRTHAVQAMRAGLDVITEKPMADSMANSAAMLRAARDTGRTCTVSQNYRYRPETWTVARAVRRGRIGDVGQVALDFHMGVDFGGGFRHEMDFPLLIDMSIHHFDLIRFVTGLDPVSVRGTTWNPPWSNYKGDCSSTVVFEMSNGAHVVYNASWCTKGSFSDWNANWRIEGGKGTLLYRQGEAALHKAPQLYKVTDVVPLPLTAPPRLSQAYVLDDVIKCRRSGQRPRTDVSDNIASVGMVFAAVKAVQTGRVVPVLSDTIRRAAADVAARYRGDA